MIGAHDLGGEQGLEPIAVTQEEALFHAQWEGAPSP